MALRVSKLKCAVGSSNTSFIRWMSHALARPAPLQMAIDQRAINIATSPPLYSQENHYQNGSNTRPELPNLPSFGGDVELMAVPKKKVSPHKRGIRNGPKALKPIPVIIRCKVCGRVKLPHFFCCSGIKPNPGEHDSSL